MKIKPVETTPRPGYPDKYSSEVAKSIHSARPRRWVAAPLAGGVLTASILLGLSGCGYYITDGLPLPSPYQTGLGVGISPTPSEYITLGNMVAPTPTQFSRIPLFEFGEGTGAIGCVAIAAPVFLSEDEAFAVLSTVFEEAGLTLDKASETLNAANRPVADLYSWEETGMTTVCEPLNSDGILRLDREGIPMVFVSAGDLDKWQRTGKDGEPMMVSSVSSYNVKGAAKALAENNDGLLVFYDPMARQDFSRLTIPEQAAGESDEAYWARVDAVYIEEGQVARAASKGLLRQQAEAFLLWLRSEGVIF